LSLKGDVCLKNLNVREATITYKQTRTNKASPAVLKDGVLFFPVPKSVEIYNKFIKANAPVAQIEKDLGNRLAKKSLTLKVSEQGNKLIAFSRILTGKLVK
jgi:hypothetical protein